MNVRIKDMQNRPIQNEKIFTRDFFLIWFTNFSVILGFQMTIPTLPLFVEKLGGSDQLIGLVVGAFTFSALLFRPFAGKALETKGRQFVLTVGLIIFVFSVGVYAFVTSLLFLFIFRLVQGVGWGLSTTATGTIAADIIPVSKRGEGIGYYGLARNLAMALGPAVGLALISVVDFSLMFAIASICGVVGLILSYFINYIPTQDQSEIPTETKRWDFFERTSLKPSFLLLFITVTFGGITSFLPLYTFEQEVKGIELYYFVFAIVMMAVRTFSGRLFDRKGIQAIFIPSALLIILAMIFLSLLTSTWMLIVAAVLYGVGFGALAPAMQAWVINRAPDDRKGMANATFFSSFDVGIGLGAIFFGFIIPWTGYKGIFAVSAAIACLSIVTYIFMFRNNKNTA